MSLQTRKTFLHLSDFCPSIESLFTQVGFGYRLNFNNSDFDSAYQIRFLLIPNFDSNKVKKIK